MRGGFRLPTDGFLTGHLEVQTLAGPSSHQPKRGDEDLFAMPFLDGAADDSRRSILGGWIPKRSLKSTYVRGFSLELRETHMRFQPVEAQIQKA